MGMNLFAQLTKVDEAKRLVFARAAQEVIDKSDEIMDYESSKPFFKAWSESVAKDSDGKSLGNVRAMHGKIAAGKLTQIDFNDDEKAVDVCAYISDDQEFRKCVDGTYTGLSIGGAYIGERKVEKIGGRDVKRYTANPSEISLVDRPCIPTAKFFQVQKADGSTQDVEFKEPDAADVVADAITNDDTVAEVTVDGTPAQVDELTALMAEKGLSINDVIALAKGENPFAAKDADKPPKGIEQAAWDKMDAKEKAAAKADAEKEPAKKAATVSDLRKGMYECSQFAQIIAAMQGLKTSAAYESYREGDDSPVPQALDACISMCAGVLKQMIDEEVAEAGEVGIPQPVMAMAEQCGELAKHEGDPLLVLVKYGARNSTTDKTRIDAIHKASVELGADCATTKAEGAGDLQKSATELTKLIEDAVAPMQKALLDAEDKIKKLEAEPRTPKVSLRAISKAQDNGEVTVNPTESDLVKDAHGAVHPAASLIKQAYAQGGSPLVYHG
jgi:hypothetical protein